MKIRFNIFQRVLFFTISLGLLILLSIYVFSHLVLKDLIIKAEYNNLENISKILTSSAKIYHNQIEEKNDAIIKTEISSVVDVSMTLLNTIYEYQINGLYTEDEAKKIALTYLKNYNQKEYLTYWLIDNNYVMLYNSTNQEWINKDTLIHRDNEGKLFYKDIVNLCQYKDKGFVTSTWTKNNKNRKKVTYVSIFKPWNWIIGAGIFKKTTLENYKNKEYDIKDFKTLIKDVNIHKSGYIYMFHKSNYMIFHPDKKLINKIVNFTDFYTGENILDKLKNNVNSIVKYTYKADNRDKINKISYVSCLKELGWYIVAVGNEDEIKKNTHDFIHFVTLFSLLIFVVLVILSYFISKHVRNPIRHTIEIIKDLAKGGGDLTKRIEVAQCNEVGEIGKWINIFIERIAEVVNEIKSSSIEIVNISSTIQNTIKELNTAVTTVSDGAQTQASSVEESNTAASEIRTSIREVESNAQKAVKISKNAHKEARIGEKSVTHTIEGMNKIKESSKQIESIVEVITDIATKTDLLALNAAIEAAKAGEHGKGFAVVADEIRKLAERSNESAKEITLLITESTERVNEGVKLSNNSGETLKNLLKAVDSTQEVIETIFKLNTEQSDGIEEIVRSIEHLANISETNASTSEEMASSFSNLIEIANNLPVMAQRLDQLVGHFKTNHEIEGEVNLTKKKATSDFEA